jgi:hypothetical protein
MQSRRCNDTSAVWIQTVVNAPSTLENVQTDSRTLMKGTDVPEPTCLNGHIVPSDAEYCPKCGARAAETNSATTTAAEQDTQRSNPSAGPEFRPSWDFTVVPDSTVTAPTSPRPRRRRKAFILIAAVTALILVVAGLIGWSLIGRPSTDDHYVQALRTAGLLDDFGGPDSAVAQGRAFCTKLSAGGEATGYKSQQIATLYYCKQFSKNFVVIPTPEEQQRNLTTALREAGLGGTFPSDAAAVASAKSVCRKLDRGGSQQGPQVAEIAVSVYCPDYTSGFKTLRPIHVRGSFELTDTDVYYSNIDFSAFGCEGTGGYSDIGPGTEVVVKDNAGKVLTTTTLGSGSGSRYGFTCRFHFAFTVMDGAEGGYVVTVSDRGNLHYSASQLQIPGDVAVTLGS